MENEQEKIDRIFLEACELKKSEQEQFLQEACGDDVEMLRKVERLLFADQQIAADWEMLAQPPLEDLAEQLRDVADKAQAMAQKESISGFADRNMLYGILALQLDFVDRDQLIKAMNTWVIAKKKRLDEILLENGDMDRDAIILLNNLVDRHIEQHDGSAAASLATLSSVHWIVDALKKIDDPDFNHSISNFLLDSATRDASLTTVALGPESTTGGRFKVLRPHNSGGLGVVSVAQDTELNREVALKEIRGKYAHNAEARGRFMIEAEVTGGLEHPGIVPVYGLGTYHDGRPYYVMRFIKGDNLEEAIKNYRRQRNKYSKTNRNLELRKLLKRFIDVCDAVTYAHDRRVLHRDLKPGNIMLGKYGETLVVDWGLAKLMGTEDKTHSSETRPLTLSSGASQHTTAGAITGTPRYMSPEQANGLVSELGPATDIYSLGATFYYLLTGKAPITDNKVKEVLAKAKTGDFPEPSSVDPDVPRALEAICLKAMKLKPTDRYGSPAAMAEDIEKWLADESVSAFSEPLLGRLSRVVRHHQPVFAGAAVLLLSGLVGLLIVNRITRAKNDQLTELNTILEDTNTQLQNSNTQLQQSEQTVKENFKTTRKLAFDLIDRSEKNLSQVPNSEATRKWLTNRTVEVFEEMHERQPNDKVLQQDLAKSYLFAANLDRLLADFESATTKYETSIKIMSDLELLVPKSVKTREILGQTLRDYAGYLLTNGKVSSAIKSYERSLAIAQGLLDEQPKLDAYKRTVATILFSSAAAKIELANHQQALAATETAARIFQELADGEKPDPLDTPLLLFAMLRQSEISRSVSELPKALEYCQEAEKRGKAYLALSPTRSARHTYARALLQLCQVRMDMKQLGDAALIPIREAIEIWQKLAEESSSDHYRLYLARAHAKQALAILTEEENEQRIALARASIAKSHEFLKAIGNRMEFDFTYPEAAADILLIEGELELEAKNQERALSLHHEAIEKINQAINIIPESKRLIERRTKLVAESR